MRSIAIPLALAATALLAADYTSAGKAWWSHIQFLADDSLEGRNTGSPGYRKAAEYVAKQFDSIGLRPAGTNGFYQPVKFKVKQIVEEQSSIELIRDGKTQPVKLGDQAYLSMRVEPAKFVEADAVFAGYGIAIPEKNYDDYKGLDLKGKFAVYFSGAPRDLSPALSAHVKSTAERAKALRAAGAVGTISFSNPKYSDVPWARSIIDRTAATMSIAEPSLVDNAGGVAIVANSDHAGIFLQGTGHTAKEIMDLDEAHKPLPHFPLKVKVRVKTEFRTSEVQSDNVAGVLQGADPKLKDEYVILSGHLDHTGTGKPIDGDAINNGAMDNASGIASILEIARALKATGGTKRSIMFLAVCGEEKGLLGSKYYSAHTTVPARNIVANINLDMFMPIVPLKAITVYGLEESDLGDWFRQVASKYNVAVEPDKEPQRGLFTRSDQYNFVKRGIPALSFKVAAVTPEDRRVMKEWLTTRYHGRTDDLRQPVNLETAAKFDEILLDMTRNIANRPDRAKWKPESFFKRFAAAR